MSFIFFFQAEDGIRDGHVTGVQTCALPICDHDQLPPAASSWSWSPCSTMSPCSITRITSASRMVDRRWAIRSEERRVGKECRARGARYKYTTKEWSGGG